jgi:hypothetical protein
VTRGAGATNHVAGTEVKNVLVEEWANAVTALSTDTKAALAGTSGTPQAANPYVTDADARNSNARTPTAHSHVEGDTTGLVADLAARVLSTDSRLSDARTPTTHAISHKAAGGDVLAGIVGGYAPLSSGLLVPTGYLGTGTAGRHDVPTRRRYVGCASKWRWGQWDSNQRGVDRSYRVLGSWVRQSQPAVRLL